MNLKKINKVIFLGGNRYNEDGPLTEFLLTAINKNYDVIVFTNKNRLKYPGKKYKTFKDSLEENDIEYIETSDFSYKSIKPYLDMNTIIFSTNCDTILKKDLIEASEKRIFNFHNASLPHQKGGSPHSWGFMQKRRSTFLTIHHLTNEIDSGEKILEKEIIFPDHIKNLEELYTLFQPSENKLFENFLENIKNFDLKLPTIKNTTDKDFYWPRLNTEKDGFIDWRWNVEDILNFCKAFDKPFEGASSYIDGVRFRLQDVELDDEDTFFHPLQYGLVYRVKKDLVWVACKNGGLKISNLQSDSSFEIKLGNRFVTPANKLIS